MEEEQKERDRCNGGNKLANTSSMGECAGPVVSIIIETIVNKYFY
jgi:hypothetical protein